MAHKVSAVKLLIVLVLQFLLMSCSAQQKANKMSEILLSERISEASTVKKIVIFGGSPMRRHEIINLLLPIDDLSIYGTLSEAEGLKKIEELGKIDIILIGGRYSEEERTRIRKYVHENQPNAAITEPGHTYEYSNPEIFNQVKKLVEN